MTFLQPMLLIALPLIAMPIVIHFMNQRRHMTVPWAAMQFLRRAKKLNAGVAKLRYWFIMAMRMLAVGGIILALSRPLATGWIGGLGSNDCVSFVILDRSPSMELQDTLTQKSKRSTALERIDSMFSTTRSSGRRFLLTTGIDEPIELTPQTSFEGLTETSSIAASTDIPGLVNKAIAYAEENKFGAIDLWVASDLHSNDWQSSSDRWNSIRSRIADRRNIRLLLLNYPSNNDFNFSVSATNFKRMESEGNPEVVLDVQLHQNSGALVQRSIPVKIWMGDSQTTVEVNMQGADGSLSGVRIPIDVNSNYQAGWLEIPPDANLADNRFHFVSNSLQSQTAAIVGSANDETDLLALALSTQNDSNSSIELQTVNSAMLSTLDWKGLRLLVWKDGTFDDSITNQLETFIAGGGTVLLFPPTEADYSIESKLLFGLTWNAMEDLESPERMVSWRTDSDLVRNTEGGEALPLGEIRWRQHWNMNGKGLVALAKSESGKPFLSKWLHPTGQLYVFHTSLAETASNLKEDGVSLYILLQRALTDPSGLSGQSTWTAGMPMPFDLQEWKAANAPSVPTIAWERNLQQGAYTLDNQFVAINRSDAEDTATPLPDGEIKKLLNGLDYRSILDDTGKESSLAREIWRVFVILMILFLLVEAWLSMPSRQSRTAIREKEAMPKGIAA